MKLSPRNLLMIGISAASLILVAGTSTLASAATARKGMTTRGVQAKLTPARVSHARELLGGTYRRSPAKRVESIQDIKTFVRKAVENELPKKFKSKASKITQAILAESERHGFDPLFVMAVIKTESSFIPNQIGGVGEIGLMQIRPTTAKWLQEKLGKKHPLGYRNEKSLYDVTTNIRIGTAYFAMLRETFNSDSPLYVAAYNMGATNVKRNLKNAVVPREYASRIMKRYVGFYEALEQQISLEKQVLEGRHLVASR